MADPHLDYHWLPDPGFLIQFFLIQGPRRSCRRQEYSLAPITYNAAAFMKTSLRSQGMVLLNAFFFPLGGPGRHP